MLMLFARYNCLDDCSAEGNANSVCSACGTRRKCCRVGVGTGTVNSDACAPTEGCTTHHCCGGGDTPFVAPPAAPPPMNNAYKAIVVLFLDGGCDSYNLLVPKSGCGTSGGYAQYASIRQDIALQQSSLLSVTAASGTQPCTTYVASAGCLTTMSVYMSISSTAVLVIIELFVVKSKFFDTIQSILTPHECRLNFDAIAYHKRL